MSQEVLLNKILTDASKTVPDLPTGRKFVVDNKEKPDPTSSGLWVEQTILSFPETSMGKAATDSDEASGILQLSVFDPDTGGGNNAVTVLVDKIKNVFKHGVSFTDTGLTVHIDQSSRNTGRESGGFFQVDVSILWRAFVTR